MRFMTLLGAAVLCLGACATGPSAYGPAGPDSSMGFETAQIENDRFRINYTAKSAQEAQDYALLRAAQVASENGYSHFKIIHGTMQDNGPGSPIATSIGVGTGRYYGRSGTNLGVGVDILDVARALEGDKATSMIEVRMLAQGSSDPNVYEAQGVIDNIRPEVFK